MFKSLEYKQEAQYSFWEIEDDEFGIVKVPLSSNGLSPSPAAAIVETYAYRNLDAGKAIAIWTISLYAADKNFAIEKYCIGQDYLLNMVYPDWNKFIPSRNEWIQRLLLIS